MLLLISATFCIASLSFYIFCLLVVLVKLSVLAKWLARKTPLRKPNHGEGIVSTIHRPKSVYDFLVLFNCFMMWLSCPWPYMIYFILLWHDIACLCWKCRLNTTHQPTITAEFSTIPTHPHGVHPHLHQFLQKIFPSLPVQMSNHF